jgi:predicted transcriptional regulator of viral defense system
MKQPIVTVNDVAKITGVSYTKANELIATCERLGLLRQISKGRRNRKFMYQEYITIVSEGTELQKGE